MRGDAARAARIWGAADAAREGLGTPRPAADRRHQYLDATRARLDEAAFARAALQGRQMTLDQAIEYALTPPRPD